MKTTSKFLLPLLLTGFGFTMATTLSARTYTVLHTFDNTNGAYPFASLIISSNTLYGTTRAGGLGGGIIFKVNIDGTGFLSLHNFTQAPPLFNDDDLPTAGGLVLSGTTLYGTTIGNAQGDSGTVFALNIDGNGFTNLYTFTSTSGSGTNADGAHPYAALVLSGTRLFGTAAWGGISGNGTVFSLNTDGSDFATLYSFTGGTDGAQPKGGLVLQSNVLYGTTFRGGNGNGTVFSINTEGTGFRTIYAFSPTPTAPYSNPDGIGPWATLSISGNTLYGTAIAGGIYQASYGTVFKINLDGTNFTALHYFTAGSDGKVPFGGVVLSNGTLYGTATYGGGVGNGAIYSVNTDGTAFASLYSFPASTGSSFPFFNTYGEVPFGGLILCSNVVYGVTAYGGSMEDGVVFSLSLEPLPQPQITASLSNAWFGLGIVLSAPTNVPGFPPIRIEQSADPLFSSFWRPGIPPDNRTNDGRVVGTFQTTPPAQFFRLSQHW